MKTTRTCHALGLALVATALGCAAPPHLPAQNDGRVWPPPPGVARIELIGEIREPSDLGVSSSAGRGFLGILSGTPIGRFETPYAIAVHGELEGSGPGGGETPGPARIAVADTGARSVHLMDLERGRIEVLAEYGDDQPLLSPVAVAFDADARLYVCDSATALILRYEPDGDFDRILARDFKRPAGLAIDRARRILYVADAGAHTVSRFDLEGGSRRELDVPFRFPTHLSVDREGRLAVADSLNFRAIVLDAGGKVLAKIGSPGDSSGSLQRPKGVAFDSEGHLYAVDAIFDNVQIFDLQGRLLLAFGSAGDAPGEFALPAGIAIDERDLIYVADSYNSRVQVFRFLGGENR